MLNLRLTALAAAAALLTACATTEPVAPVVDTEKVRLEQELAAAKAEQARLSTKVNTLEAAKAAAPAPVAAPAPAPAAGGSDSFPINAKPGECYARVVNPPVFETRKEKVVAKAASERVEIIPAKFEYVEEKVMVKPAGKKIIYTYEDGKTVELTEGSTGGVPTRYKTVQEKVLVKAASEKIEQTPATYKTVEEKQLVKPATTMWKKGRGPIEKMDNISGEIMCLVEVPAEYRVVKTTVVDQPASVKRTPIPAEYANVPRQVAMAVTSKEIDLAAEYKGVKVLKQTVAAEEKRIPIAAEYQEVSRQVLVTEGTSDWKSILCETNTTAGVVQGIQRALLAKGFNPGKIDGVIGAETSAAIRAFQQANGLATGGLTMETLSKLGVNVNRV